MLDDKSPRPPSRAPRTGSGRDWPAYADALHAALLGDARVQLVAALPESLLKHVYRRLSSQDEIRYVR